MSGLEGEAHLVRVDWEQENEPRCTALVRWIPPVTYLGGRPIHEVMNDTVDSLRYLLEGLGGLQ